MEAMTEDRESSAAANSAGWLKPLVGVGCGLILGALAGIPVGLLVGVVIAMILGVL